MSPSKKEPSLHLSGRARPLSARAPIAYFLTYDPSLPSFRHRLQPVVDQMHRERWQCHVDTLPKGSYIHRILKRRRALAKADLLVLGKISLGLGESLLLQRLGPRIVFDFDDAIYLRKPDRLGAVPGHSPIRRFKFRETCGVADLVIAGNRYLARAAQPCGSRLEIVPTSVELPPAHTPTPPGPDGSTLVWIGRPENLPYLEILRPALARLARIYPDLRLRVICSHFPDWPEIQVERIPWDTTVEGPAIASGDIGVMPLEDDSWTRGKCGFKLLQYMSHSLPVVASPVGVNTDIVGHGVRGFLARNMEEWENALLRLLDDDALRRTLGEQGRAHVERYYARGTVIENKMSLLRDLVLSEEREQLSTSSIAVTRTA